MRGDVDADAKDPWFKARADGLLSGLSELGKVEAVHAHARGSIRFQRDEATGEGIGALSFGENDPLIEVIVRPLDMARYVDGRVAVGDCDDFSMYCAALLESQGVPCAFVTVAADGRDPNQYSHVYVAAYPKDWNGNRVRVALDASHGEYAGWEVPNKYGKRAEWPVEGGLGVIGTFVASLAATWVALKVFGKEVRV